MLRMTSISLNGDWRVAALDPISLPHTDTRAWLPAKVPGHVHLDLMAAGVIPDPFARMHEWTCAWVDDRDWVYERDFGLVEAEEDSRWVLRFGGLDTVARVLLNGVELGRTEDMFVPQELDVTRVVRPGSNLLRVEFTSAKRVGESRLDKYPIGDVSKGWAPRSFVRKAQYHFGWDWGPTLIGCGIWRDVELLRVPAGHILDWQYATRFSPDGSCVVEVKARTECRTPGGEMRFSLRRGDYVAQATARADEDGRATVILEIPEPVRWWPHGLGEAALYDVTLTLGQDDECWDRMDARIGLRELKLVQEADAAGSSFHFRVNGVPFFTKGANWIPADSFPARVTRDDYHRQLGQAVAANMNMLRVWGGGYYETEEFYTLCDELGLLVWQDFPFACARYPVNPEFLS